MKISNNMQEFLIKSYFGDTDDEGLYETCAWRAYQDVARSISYFYTVSTLQSMKNDDKDKVKDFKDLKESFKSEIVNILKDEKESQVKPRELIEQVLEKVDQYSAKGLFLDAFTYGHAQKWVNMFFKYLWLFEELPIDEKELDVPIDSYIIHAITKDAENNKYGFSVLIEGLKDETAWSALDEDLYIKIQDEIKKGIGRKYSNLSLLEWETKAWSEQMIVEV